jgi:hypothetical protein
VTKSLAFFDVQRCAVDDGTGGAGGLDGHVGHGVQIKRHKLWGKNWMNRLAMQTATIAVF